MVKEEKNLHPLNRAHAHRSIGQRAADAVAKLAGSWVFIFIFCGFLLLWIIANGILILKYNQTGDPWDPYPFILLNLFLSCLAAIQAPIILMSQNREAERDRINADYNYAVNRKAEKEIREIKDIILKMKK